MCSLRAAVAASAAALSLLTLAGCGDDPDPGGPESTWTPTSTPESPTSAATQAPVEPELPEAATKATEDGARAFVGYYFDLVNYAQRTGDTKTLVRVSGPNCHACNGINQRLREQYSRGGSIDGGRNVARVQSASELTTPSKSALGYQLLVDVSHDAQIVRDGNGNAEERPAGSDKFILTLLWTSNETWRLDVMEVE